MEDMQFLFMFQIEIRPKTGCNRMSESDFRHARIKLQETENCV